MADDNSGWKLVHWISVYLGFAVANFHEKPFLKRLPFLITPQLLIKKVGENLQTPTNIDIN